MKGSFTNVPREGDKRADETMSNILYKVCPEQAESLDSLGYVCKCRCIVVGVTSHLLQTGWPILL
jgi:hypothetical protein